MTEYEYVKKMSKKNKIALIILAAGKSTRFPGNKLLAKINNESMIEKVVKTGLNSKADNILIVVGHEAEKISKSLENIRDARIQVIYNPRYEEGQSSSVKTGVEYVVGKADAVMILPADVPFITPEDIDRLIEVYEITNSTIVVASYRGRHGHPILFSSKLFNELMMITEEKHGLKEVIEKHREEIVEAESSPFTLIDIDTQEDLEKILKMY
ncbi:MAG: nucleotidyltransferase family protein [Nitrososphaerota archaeon]